MSSRRRNNAQAARETSSAVSRKPGAANPFQGRDALGAYLVSPSSFPPSRVLYHTPDFVAINDLWPKSSVHILLLPRRPLSMLKLHPIEAFDRDPALLAACKAEAAKAVKLVASELRRRFARFSAQDRARYEAMEHAGLALGANSGGGSSSRAEESPGSMNGSLAVGRNWDREVLTGVHAGPSMSHLHLHILSVDRCSPGVRHRKHYNSFATKFLISLGEFPLAKDDARRLPSHGGYLGADLVCWRCGRNFGNRFKELKSHIDEFEFEEWKRE